MGIIAELPQICLAICDTHISPFTYTGSENIEISNHQLSLKFPM